MNMQNKDILRIGGGQEGFILITSILILVVLTLLATAMYNTSLFEIMIAGTQKQTQQQFYLADAGINATIAENEPPPQSMQVSSPDTFTCDDAATEIEFTRFDIDGDTVDDVFLYLIRRDPAAVPPEIRVASCATTGDVFVGIYAGLNYGSSAGAQEGQGDALEDNPL